MKHQNLSVDKEGGNRDHTGQMATVGQTATVQKTFEGESMRMQKRAQTLALLFWVSACDMTGICKTDADCQPLHADAYCYVGKNSKPGSDGVCTRKPGGAVDEPDGGFVDKPGGGSVDEPGGGFVDEPGGGSGIEAVISSFSPLEAPHGAELLIQGKGFSAVPSENSVTLNGVPATLVSAIENEIVVKVPKSFRCTGPVRVTTGGKTAISDNDFTYVPTIVVSTLAGSGVDGFADGPGSEAQFANPQGMAIDTAGNLYVADNWNNRIRKITPLGEVSTLAGNGEGGLVNDIGSNAEFNSPEGIAIDPAGNLYVGDSLNHRIRKITPTSLVSTFAGSGDTDYEGGGFFNGLKSDALFRYPTGIAIDSAGNFYVADTWNHSIRKISAKGIVSTLAGNGQKGFADGTGSEAQFSYPQGMAIDAKTGNLYVADWRNHCVRKISPQGEVSTLVDDAGIVAQFAYPSGIAIDAKGNLYVAGNNRIRKVTPSGKVSLIVGSDEEGFADGPAETARFHWPDSVAINAEGTLYVAERGNNRIRKIILE